MSNFGSQSFHDYYTTRFSELLNPCRDPSKNWDIDIAEKLGSYMAELAEVAVGLEKGQFFLNFSEAALLIQGSASIFGKKVELLYGIVCSLCRQLHQDKKNVESGKANKDVLLIGRHSEDFVALDDIKKSTNLNLADDPLTTHKKTIRKLPCIPLALIPLDSREKGNVMLYNIKGEALGNKNDFHLSVCNMHSSGCLLIPSMTFDLSSLETPGSYQEQTNTMSLGTDVETENTPTDSEPTDGVNVNCSSTPPNSPMSARDGSPLPSPSAPSPSLGSPERLEPVPAVQENGKSPEIEGSIADTTGVRRSVRQAKRAERDLLLQEQQEKQKEMSVWVTDLEDLETEECKKVIEKKNVKRVPRKLRKRKQVNEKADDCNTSTLGFCSENFFNVESKFSKKMSITYHALSVNTAFEHIVYDRMKKQQDLFQTCRKKLKLDEDVALKEEPKEEQRDTDMEDNDLGTDVLPDTDVCTDDAILDSALNSVSLVSRSQDTNSDAATESYEELVRKYVENYIKEMSKFSQTNELSQKVSKWEDRIKPILECESEREIYNIHVYGSRIIENFENNNRKQTLPFSNVCKGKKKWEVCRYFLALLQLVNNNNLEIDASRLPSGNHEINLTLLSRKRHQEELDEFGHTHGEHT